MSNPAPAPAANPFAVEVTRGRHPDDAFVESRHTAACAVVAADGTVVHGWGDVERAIFPRSAIKPIQVLPLLETGAADAFSLSDAEISLACASHNSEARHIETVTALLDRIGLSPEALECGLQISVNEQVKLETVRGGAEASRLRNNCSGKHAGFLTTAVHMGEHTAGYIGRDHPVQQRIFQTISEMCEIDVTQAPEGIDGCSIPALALPLRALAHGMAKLAASTGLGAVREAACKRVVEAIAAEPFMMAGSGRFCTAINGAMNGKAVVKTGAEGVMMAAVPALGFGIALKIDDGAGRANGVAMAAVLRRLGILSDAATVTIADYVRPPVYDLNNRLVGHIRHAAGWPPI